MIRRRGLARPTSEVREILLKPFRLVFLSHWALALEQPWVRDYWFEHRDELMAEYAATPRTPGQPHDPPNEPLGWHVFEKKRSA